MSLVASVNLLWLPLGAGGGGCVRGNGRLYEALAARRANRAPLDLYHSALLVLLGADRYAIEMAPAWSLRVADRGVVAGGPVGLAWLGRSPLFRYEVRRWRNGYVPDAAEAVAGPRELSTDPGLAARVLDLVPAFPAVTWGRDDLGTGDMWNSNSLVSWLLARGGYPADLVPLPAGGRAPGWLAGMTVARRQMSRRRVRPGAGRDRSAPDPILRW
jgi:hypothetical protein